MKRLLLAILCLAAAVASSVPRLGARDLWPPDEARYASVTREVASSDGSPLLPRLNGVVYDDKPPGYFLAASLAGRLTGTLDEAAVRWPSVVAGVFCVVLTALFVARIAGNGVGFVAGTALLGFHLFAYQMRQAQLDMLVAAMVTAAMASFFAAWNGGSRWYCAVGWLFVALGFFVKGPLALLAPVVALFFALLTLRPRAFLNGGTFAGIVLAAGLAAAWLYAVYRMEEGRGVGLGDEYLRQLWRNVEERAERGMAHEKPWHAYLRLLPLNLLPLTPLLLLLCFRRVRTNIWEGARPLLRFALLWLGVGVVAFSCVPGKREIYLLPLYPAAAILVALAVDGAVVGLPRTLRTLAGAAALGIALLAFGAIAIGDVAVFGRVVSELDVRFDGAATRKLLEIGLDPSGSEAFRSALRLHGALVLPLAFGAFLLAAAGSARAAVGFTGIAVGLAVGLGVALLLPHADVEVSRRKVADALAALIPADAKEAPVGFFHHVDEGVLWYFGRPLPEIAGKDRVTRDRPDPVVPEQREAAKASLRSFLSAPGAMVVLREKDIVAFGLEAGVDFDPKGRAVLGGDRAFVFAAGVRP